MGNGASADAIAGGVEVDAGGAARLSRRRRSCSSAVDEEDPMVLLMPESPRGIIHSPPLAFAPQAPLIPLQKLEEMQEPQDLWLQQCVENEPGNRIPTMITWSGGGRDVFLEGSWDNWRTRKPMDSSGNGCATMKMLSSGSYRYRFIVDGERKHAADMPSIHDGRGNIYNVLNLQEYVPDDLKGVAGFEPPQSPESSYDNRRHEPEDYRKEPPTVPPQLQAGILNKPSDMNNSDLGRPLHVVLNHLYVQRGKGRRPAVALGETCRFLGKYVTVVLYKSL